MSLQQRKYRTLHIPTVSHERLFPCGLIWEYYRYTDSDGNPININQPTYQPILHVNKNSKDFELLLLLDQTPPIPITAKPILQSSDNLTRSSQRAARQLRRLVNLNNLYIMITFTFAPKQDKSIGFPRKILPLDDQKCKKTIHFTWNKFLTALRRRFSKEGRIFRWVKVLEKHDSEETSEEKRGTYHIHLATDLFTDYETLLNLWGYGIINIKDFRTGKTIGENKIKESLQTSDPGSYMSKYVSKDMKSGHNLNERRFSCSHHLDTPKPIKDRASIRSFLLCPEEWFNKWWSFSLSSEQHKQLQTLDIEDICTYQNRYEVKIQDKERQERNIFVEYKKYNFRKL